MNKQSENLDDELEVIIEHKIEEMENLSYEFPKRFMKKDYIAALAVAILCFALILIGANL